MNDVMIDSLLIIGIIIFTIGLYTVIDWIFKK